MASHKDLTQNSDHFFPVCIKLTEKDRAAMEKVLKPGELEYTSVISCGPTPLPGHIAYSVYKTLWSTLGKHFLEACNFSKERVLLPESKLNSSITLLPKEGKNLLQKITDIQLC